MATMRANGIDLYYEVTGEGQPLVFVHGLGSSTQDWEHQVPVFAKSYQVITFDLRGHGRSAKPAGPYDVPMFAHDLAGLLLGLDIPAAHVVGISLGGGVAFEFAIDYPVQTKTLTIVNSSPTLGPVEQVQPEIERRVGIVQQLGMGAMGQALATGLFPKPEQAPLRDTFVGRWAQNDPNAYIAATRSMLGWNVMNRLGEIKCPALIISADQDYSPVAVKEMYVKLMSNAKLAVIPDTHHAVPIEKPDEFNRVLQEFLAQHP